MPLDPLYDEVPLDGRQRNPWTTLRSTLKYENRWIRVVEHDVLTPRGEPGIYGTVHYRQLGIAILPIDGDGCTYLVGQYRYPLDRYSWEIPEGGGALDVDPLDSARRELAEEAGLTARHWLEILRLDLSNSISDEQAICYLAWGLDQCETEPDETEQLQIRRVPFDEVLAMIARGDITDALSVATVHKLQLMVLSGEAPAEIAAAVGTAAAPR